MKRSAIRPLAACALTAALLGACASGGFGEGSPVANDVYQAVKLQTVADASRVTVREAGGIVTLNGFVKNVSDVDRLVAEASAVEGVIRVRSNLTVLSD